MAALVQQTANSSTAASSFTWTLNGLTSGNLVTVLLMARDTTSTWTSVTGVVNATYSPAAVRAGAAIYYFQNSGAGDETVTVNWTPGANQTYFIQIIEWSGIATTGALDQSNTVSGGAPSGPPYNYACGASITPAGAGVVIGCASVTGNVTKTVGSGYTALGYTPADPSRPFSQYDVIGAGGTGTTAPFTADSSFSYVGAIANFLDAAGAGGQAKRTHHYNLNVWG